MSSITPLGLFSAVLLPGQAFELETLAADVQLTGISFGAEVKGEGRSSVKLTYFDRSHSNFGLNPPFGDSDDESDDMDDEDMEGEEAAETDDEDDSGAVDEQALKAAMKEAAEKRKELVAAANVPGVSPRKLAQQAAGDASMDLQVDEDDEDDDEDDDMMSDVSEDELKEVFIGNLLPGRIEQAPVNFVLKYMDSYEFSVTGENAVYLTGHYCHVPPPQFGDDDSSDGSDYGEEFDSDDLSDEDEQDDQDRFQELVQEAASAAPSKKSKAAAKAAKAHTIPAAQIDDLSMDMDDNTKTSSAKTAAATVNAGDVSTEGLSKNQKKKLKKAQAQAGVKETPAAAAPAAAAPKAETAAAPKAETSASTKKASKKTTLPSGLVYEDVKAGAGAAAKKGQKVSMRYIGKLQNGNIFDSNTKGKPFEFKLGAGQVIKGWDEGIAGMQPGGERRLTIPAKMGYGKSGTEGIPGNATLIFEVKLLSIK